MRAVGIKELKNRLSEYVRIAAGGERVLVTDRDRVVAELIAPQPGTPQAVGDVALAEAVRAGWLRPPVLPVGTVPPRAPIMPLADLLAELDDDRADRADPTGP
jgi:antitoxin (DNA-binding transcriptional repressor) of toxin-antitoxin stability system